MNEINNSDKNLNITNLKTDAVNALDNFLSDLLSKNDENETKRAKLISFWIKDYVRLLKKEKQFNPSKLISYERGNIVKINLGFRIGSEQGGLHYAVVIENSNPKQSNTVTVIPLSSMRDGRKIHKTSVVLGTEIFREITSKHDRLFNKLTCEIKELEEEINSLESMLPFQETTSSTEFTERLRLVKQKQEFAKAKVKELELLNKELSKMKRGSVALVGQITTISKLRIYDPLYSHSVLYGIKISNQALDLINEKIIELFTFSKNTNKKD